MNKKAVLIVWILLAFGVSSCNLRYERIDLEAQAKLEAAQAQADIDRAKAAQDLSQAADLHAVELAAAQAAAAERAIAEKTSIYATELGKAVAIGAGVFYLGVLAISLSIASIGGGLAFWKKAQVWADTIHAHPKTLLYPVLRYRITAPDGSNHVYIKHLGTGENFRADLANPADRQQVAGLLALQQTGMQVNGAVKAKGSNEVFSAIQPDHIGPNWIDVEDMSGKLVENKVEVENNEK